MQKMVPGAERLLPPRLAVRPELTDDDVAWLNGQMAMVDNPPVRYVREIPLPPPSGRYRVFGGRW